MSSILTDLAKVKNAKRKAIAIVILVALLIVIVTLIVYFATRGSNAKQGNGADIDFPAGGGTLTAQSVVQYMSD